MALPLTSAELRADWVLLLEVEWASRVYRWSSGATVQIASDDGDLTFSGGLPAAWDDAFDPLSTDPSARSMSFSDLYLPPDVSAAELVAAGHDLAAARGRVSLWAPGRTYEDRIRVLSGRVYAPTYGGASEPIGLTVEAREFDDRAYLISPDARITAETWPFSDSAAHGRAYPFVFGTPGRYTEPDGTEGKTTGSPAYVVQEANKRLLIAGHRVTASTVRIIDVTKAEARDCPVEHLVDGLGRTVAVANAHGTGLTITAGDTYFARWDSGTAAIDDDGSALRFAGDVLRYLLRRSSLDYDRGRFATVVGYLNRFRLDGYADDPDVTIWDYIADNLLPILPVSIVGGANGLRPILYRVPLRVLDAVDAIEAGPNAVRSSPIQYSTEDPIQRVSVRYALRADSGDHLLGVTLTGDRLEAGSTDSFAGRIYASGTASLRRSASRYLLPGEAPREERIETEIVTDTATAELIAETIARIRALPYREVSYALDLHRFGALEPGDVVTITDGEVAFTEEPAIVRSVSWTSTTADVRLIVPAGGL